MNKKKLFRCFLVTLLYTILFLILILFDIESNIINLTLGSLAGTLLTYLYGILVFNQK